MKDDTSRTATITPTTAADVPCSENNSNLSNDQFQKCALPCQLRGLVTRGVLIDKSRGSIITFTLGVALIAICWGLLAAFSKESDNLSKWWYDTSSIVGQVCLPYSILRYTNCYSQNLSLHEMTMHEIVRLLSHVRMAGCTAYVHKGVQAWDYGFETCDKVWWGLV